MTLIEFSQLKERKQQDVLKLYPVFPSGSMYGCRPTLDEFLQFVSGAKKLGYTVKQLWTFYSGWGDVPLELHAIATKLSVNWTK